MSSLRTQLSLVIVFVVLSTVTLISFLSNSLINKQFEAYITKQQKTRAETISENIGQYYNGLTNAWDLASIHALSMYSLYDGYIIKVYDNKGVSVWDSESHDMRTCQQIMGEISKRMAAHGESGEFSSQNYELTQNGQKIGAATIKYYGPFFLSESDFSFLSALNVILITIGALSLVFSFVAGWVLARRITRPIQKTVDIARQIAAGQYNVQFERQTKTRELHDLMSALNHLANALDKQESLRKQLTADVAHELRTPLTTLGSHLEAMIEHIWTPTPKRLKSCYEETQRLGMLIADLENLAEIESENLKLNKSQVNL
jgi:HAMP domain-containing protein